MIIHDPEFERWYWDRPKVLAIFGNGLPTSVTDGAKGDEWPFFDDRLLPHNTFLQFNPAFIDGCIADSTDSLGTYTNGWEL